MRQRFPWLIPLVVGIVALIAGWVVGTLMACSGQGCSFDTDKAGVLGTWVGGLGTIGALIVVGFQVSGDFEERALKRANDEAVRRSEIERAQSEAQLVDVEVWVSVHTANRPVSVGARVTNRASQTAIYKVEIAVHGYGKAEIAHLGPRGQDQKYFPSSGWDDPPGPPTLDRRPAEEEKAELLAATVTEFDMNEVRWRREADRPAYRVGPALG